VSDLIHDPTYTYQSSARSARSFRGAIDAVNVVRQKQELGKIECDDNWNGLIKAILSLNSIGGVPIGELPPQWDIIIDPETGNPIGGIQGPVEDGQLWFDVRQGRLFIFMGDGWFQTNGADGITAVQEEPPQGPPIGSYWYNTTNGVLYMWDGDSWEAIGGAVNISTSTLPLSNPVTDAFANLRESRSVLPEPVNLIFQEDANHYFVECLSQLDEIIEILQIPDKPTVTIGDAPPLDPEPGMMWFDSAAVDLLCYYDDGQTQQWVPTSATYLVDTKVDSVIEDLELEVASRVSAVKGLRTELTTKHESNLSKIHTLENQQITLSNRIDHLQEPDLSSYAVEAEVNQALLDLSPLLKSFIQAYPQIQLHLNTSTELADLNKMEADVAIRLTNNPPEHLVGRELARVEFGVFANQDYLSKWQQLPKPETCEWILWQGVSNSERPEAHYPDQLLEQENIGPVIMKCSQVADVLAMIKQGAGVGLLACVRAKQEAFVRLPFDDLLLKNQLDHAGLWILRHKDMRRSEPVKIFIQYIQELIEETL